MNERTLTEQERRVLAALAKDADEVTAKRAQALIEWAMGGENDRIARSTGLRRSQVAALARAFSQKRLEVFAPAVLERGARGALGTTTVEALVRQHRVDLGHARHVATLALALFRATASVHRLPAEYCRVLETGALLHNVGLATDAAQHQRAGCKIILGHDLEGYTSTERDLLALLARWHYKKVNPPRDPVWSALDPETQRAALELAALLRVADGLDESQSHSTRIVRVTVDSLVEVLLEGPYGAVDAARANKKADLWRQVLSPPFFARVETQSATPTVKPNVVTVRTAEPMTRAGKKLIAAQFVRMQTLAPGVQAGDDPEKIHDMRVATRRMRAALRLVRPFYRKKQWNRIERPVGALGSQLGMVRDLDVQLERLALFGETLAGAPKDSLRTLRETWDARRATAHAQLAEWLNVNYANWAARVQELLAEDEPESPRVSDVVPGRIWKQYGAVRAFEPHLRQADLETLHRLRMQARRLRYSIEFFAEPLGAQAPRLIEPLVALQDHLGDLHDADVAAREIGELLMRDAQAAAENGAKGASLDGVVAYLDAVKAKRLDLQAAVLERWQVIIRPPYRQALGEALANL